MKLTCAVSPSGDAVTVTLVGDADLTTVDQLRTVLADAAAERPSRIVVDLSGLVFIDSVGIGALVVAYRATLRRGIGFVLTQPRGYVRRALTVTGVLDALTRGHEVGAA